MADLSVTENDAPSNVIRFPGRQSPHFVATARSLHDEAEFMLRKALQLVDSAITGSRCASSAPPKRPSATPPKCRERASMTKSAARPDAELFALVAEFRRAAALTDLGDAEGRYREPAPPRCPRRTPAWTALGGLAAGLTPRRTLDPANFPELS